MLALRSIRESTDLTFAPATKSERLKPLIELSEMSNAPLTWILEVTLSLNDFNIEGIQDADPSVEREAKKHENGAMIKLNSSYDLCIDCLPIHSSKIQVNLYSSDGVGPLVASLRVQLITALLAPSPSRLSTDRI